MYQLVTSLAPSTVFFDKVVEKKLGPLTLWQPDILSINWVTIVLSLIAALALFRGRIGLGWTLLLNGSLAFSWYYFLPYIDYI